MTICASLRFVCFGLLTSCCFLYADSAYVVRFCCFNTLAQKSNKNACVHTHGYMVTWKRLVKHGLKLFTISVWLWCVHKYKAYAQCLYNCSTNVCLRSFFFSITTYQVDQILIIDFRAYLIYMCQQYAFAICTISYY